MHLNLTEVLQNIYSNEHKVVLNDGVYFSEYDGNVKEISVGYGIETQFGMPNKDITGDCSLTYIFNNEVVSEIRDVGKYIVIVNCNERYNNEKWTFIYEVKPIDVSDDLTVGVLSTHTYNGEQQNPTLEVKYGDDVWTEGV